MLRAPGDGQVMRVELRTLQSWRGATGATVGDGVGSQRGNTEGEREGGKDEKTRHREARSAGG